MAFLRETGNLLLNKGLLHHHHPICAPAAARRVFIPSSLRFLNDGSNTRLANSVEESNNIERTSSSLADSLSRLRRVSSPNQVLSDVLGQSSSPYRGPRMDNNFQGRTGLRRFDAIEDVKANTVVVKSKGLLISEKRKKLSCD